MIAPELLPQSDEVISLVMVKAGPLGRGSHRELKTRLWMAMNWVRARYRSDRGDFGQFAETVGGVALGRFMRKYSRRELDEEIADERERDGLTSDEPLIAYVGKARAALDEKQRQSSWRYRVGRERDRELIDETAVRIIEIVRRWPRPFPFSKYEMPGRPTYLQIYEDVRAEARRKRRLTLMIERNAPPPRFSPSPEELLLAREHEHEIGSFVQRLASRLTKKQRRWLEIFTKLAHEEVIVSPAQAAHELGVHKSQAGRALESLAAAARRFRLIEDPPSNSGRRHRGPALAR